MSDHVLLLSLAPMEVAGLRALIEEFGGLLSDTAENDELLAPLSPVAYRDDEDAQREFRRLTEGDLLARRRDDAQLVARDLAAPTLDEDSEDPVELAIDEAGVDAWMRTLSAIRLIVGTRLGVIDDDHDPEDPRYGVFDWLGYRLSALVDASDAIAQQHTDGGID